MPLLPDMGREHVSTPAGIEGGLPLADEAPGLLGELELHRPAGLLLNHGRSNTNPPAGAQIVDLRPNKVAAPKLAVDGEIEHRKIALEVLQLGRTRMVQTSFGFNGRFGPIRRPLFQGSRRRGSERDFSLLTVVSFGADPFHLSSTSPSTSSNSLRAKGAVAPETVTAVLANGETFNQYRPEPSAQRAWAVLPATR